MLLNDKVKRSGRRNAHAAQLQTLKNLPWATPNPKKGTKRTKSLRARGKERKKKKGEEEEEDEKEKNLRKEKRRNEEGRSRILE